MSMISPVNSDDLWSQSWLTSLKVFDLSQITGKLFILKINFSFFLCCFIDISVVLLLSDVSVIDVDTVMMLMWRFRCILSLWVKKPHLTTSNLGSLFCRREDLSVSVSDGFVFTCVILSQRHELALVHHSTLLHWRLARCYFPSPLAGTRIENDGNCSSPDFWRE